MVSNHCFCYDFVIYVILFISLIFVLFGQRPRRGQSPVEHRGTFVRPFVRSSPQPLSGLKSALSGLKSALSGLKSALSGLESALSGLKSALFGLKSVLSGLKSAL